MSVGVLSPSGHGGPADERPDPRVIERLGQLLELIRPVGPVRPGFSQSILYFRVSAREALNELAPTRQKGLCLLAGRILVE